MDLELLRKINDLPLVTGFEHLHVDRLVDIILDYGLDVELSGLNIVHLASDSNIVFLAHYDEIGFVVDNKYSKYLYRTIPMGLISWEMGYGKMFQTMIDGKIVKAVGSSPMPHTETDERRLFLEILDDVDIPSMWPFVFENRIIRIGDRLYSRALDNRASVVLLLEMARDMKVNFILTHGEEQGTTRLDRTLEYVESRLKDPKYIVLDVMYSSDDQHAPFGLENKIGYVAVEGGGRGNVAPGYLIELAKRVCDTEIKTKSKYEVTDATTLYRLGRESISILYGVRYLHSSLECIELKNYELLKERLKRFDLEK
ncbi:MAG: hypothetical protein N3C61_00895 [Candidatus Micrarchaeota archaeon]|nr:hypothetical protein [Candidatus Micrarchaeota archaeon]